MRKPRLAHPFCRAPTRPAGHTAAMATTRSDLLVVGGGVLGLAHGCLAARRGLSVRLLERSVFARGASVRNFGMVWPVGQPAGDRRTLALRSRALWAELAALAGFRCEPTGSLHVAHHADELAVLEEFAAVDPGAGTTVLSAAEALAKSPRLCADGLRGALFSPHEANVDSPRAIAALHRWLGEQPGCSVHHGLAASALTGDGVLASDGREFAAERVLVCSGDDFASLCPTHFAKAPLRRSRLQMLRTVPQPGGWRLGPMLAAGLTLLHYDGFRACPTLPALKARLTAQWPEQWRDGIHVLVSQRDDGSLVLGDSHEYGREFALEVDAGLEPRILDYLATFFRPAAPAIAARWTGTYAQRTDGGFGWVEVVDRRTTIVTGFGGAGMTLSMGAAEHVLDCLLAGRDSAPRFAG